MRSDKNAIKSDSSYEERFAKEFEKELKVSDDSSTQNNHSAVKNTSHLFGISHKKGANKVQKNIAMPNRARKLRYSDVPDAVKSLGDHAVEKYIARHFNMR